MKQLIKLLVFTLLSAVLFDKSSACAGHQIKMNYVRTNGTLMTFLEDTTVSINQKCELSIKLCLDIEAYSTLKIKYNLFHNNFLMISEDDDVCQPKPSQINYNLYGFSTKCPVKKNHYCNVEPQKMNIMRLKRLVNLFAGNYTIQVTINHDKLQSWFTYDYSIYKL